jgi:hypothetical protein
VRAPQWFKEQLAAEGGRVLEHETTDDAATDRLKNLIIFKYEPFNHAIVRGYVRKKLRDWTTQHTRGAYLAGDSSAQLDMFPELPRHLEVSPGRFADQAVMTAHDWEGALRQAKTKSDNASGYVKRVQEAYDKVRPLLTNDDLTTSDVWVAGWTGEAAGGG